MHLPPPIHRTNRQAPLPLRPLRPRDGANVAPAGEGPRPLPPPVSRSRRLGGVAAVAGRHHQTASPGRGPCGRERVLRLHRAAGKAQRARRPAGPGGRRKYPPEYPEPLTASGQETQKPRRLPRFSQLPVPNALLNYSLFLARLKSLIRGRLEFLRPVRSPAERSPPCTNWASRINSERPPTPRPEGA